MPKLDDFLVSRQVLPAPTSIHHTNTGRLVARFLLPFIPPTTQQHATALVTVVQERSPGAARTTTEDTSPNNSPLARNIQKCLSLIDHPYDISGSKILGPQSLRGIEHLDYIPSSAILEQEYSEVKKFLPDNVENSSLVS